MNISRCTKLKALSHQIQLEPTYVYRIFGRYSREHLHESVVRLKWTESRSSFTNTSRSNNILGYHRDSWNSFKSLQNTKCTSKLEGRLKKMLFTRKLKPKLNVRTDPINSCYSVCLATCSVIMLHIAAWRIQHGTVNTTLQNQRNRWQ